MLERARYIFVLLIASTADRHCLYLWMCVRDGAEKRLVDRQMEVGGAKAKRDTGDVCHKSVRVD